MSPQRWVIRRNAASYYGFYKLPKMFSTKVPGYHCDSAKDNKLSSTPCLKSIFWFCLILFLVALTSLAKWYS